MEESSEVLEILSSMILKQLQLMDAKEGEESECDNGLEF